MKCMSQAESRPLKQDPITCACDGYHWYQNLLTAAAFKYFHVAMAMRSSMTYHSHQMSIFPVSSESSLILQAWFYS
jgi:hypothetical protein